MAYEEENIVQEWLDYLKDLNVETKKMFGCYCLSLRWDAVRMSPLMFCCGFVRPSTATLKISWNVCLLRMLQRRSSCPFFGTPYLVIL